VQLAPHYSVGSDWSASFSEPVNGLLLYLGLWRPATYAFDRPFAIVSGLAQAGVTGNALTLPEPGFHSGILRFLGPVSALSVDSSSSDFPQQVLTFGSDPIPEPATLSLGCLALLIATNVRREGNRATSASLRIFRLTGVGGQKY
jgi:hypothetical protein